MFKLTVIKVFVVLLLLSSNCEASILKNEDATTILPEAVETTEASEFPTAASLIDASSIQSEHEEAPVSDETISSDETPTVEVQNGSYFLLMMTILQDWNDEFMNKESDAFLQLAKKLGGELVDFVDNSQETSEMNVTDFKLVEVQPVQNSLSAIYVTFVVSSKHELNGEELSSALSNRILIYGEIYEHKVSLVGFTFRNISQEEAERDFGVSIMCESAENPTPSDTSSTTSSTVVKDMNEIDTPENHHEFEEKPTCKSEKIQRGSTSIYIFEDQHCVSGVRNKFTKQTDEDFEGSQMLNDQPRENAEHGGGSCGKTSFKRSTVEDDEIVVVIKKRGDKVFVEF